MREVGRPASVIVAFVLFLTLSGVLFVLSPQRAQAQDSVGGVGPWTEQTEYGATSGSNGSGGIKIFGQSCVAYNSSVYCVGGQDLATGNDTSKVYFAPVSASGTVGAWNETTDYGALSGDSGTGGIGVEWPSCVQSDVYIYCFAGGTSTSPFFTSKVFYARLSSSGVGPWIETTDYGAASGNAGNGGMAVDQLACVVDGGYVYCVGDGSGTSKVFFAQLTANGIERWTETTDYGAATGSSGAAGVAIGSTACVDDLGYIYCVGGTVSQKPVSDVFYAPVNSSGAAAWTETTDYGARSGSIGAGGLPVYGTSCVLYSANIICVAGDTTRNAGTADVFYAQAPPGPLSVWTEASVYPQEGSWMGCTSFYEFLTCEGGGSSAVNTAPFQSASSSSNSTIPSSSTASTSSISSAGTTTPSNSSTITSTASTSSTSSSTSSTGLGILPEVALVVVLGLAVVGVLFFFRKRGGTRTPPPPFAPPPGGPVSMATQLTPPNQSSHKKQEGCDAKTKGSDEGSRFKVDVDVSDYWWNQDHTNAAENTDLVVRVGETIREDEDWDQDVVGTAVAASDGAAVGGSVDAGAKIWTIGPRMGAEPWSFFSGQQRILEATARGPGRVPIEARIDGQTEIELEVDAAPGVRTAISAAVLAVVKASASVSDPSARLLAYLEQQEFLLKFTELLNDVAKRIKEAGDAKNYLAYRNALDELNALTEKLKMTILPAEKANLTKEAAAKAEEIFEEFGPVYKAEMAEFVVPYLVKTVGKWYFADADVEVEVEGSLKFNFGGRQPGSIDASASMELEVKSGEVKKPDQYENGKLLLSEVKVRRAVGSSSALREMKIGIGGDVITKGRAFDGGEGNGWVDSLWAAAWAWGCRGPREEVGAPRQVNFDCTFGARFVLPQAVQDQYPGVEGDELRDTVTDWMKDRLDALLNAASLSQRLPSPLDDPAAAQGALEDVLESWLQEVQEKWSLFTK